MMAKRATLLLAMAMTVIAVQFYYCSMTHAISTGDLGIHLSNLPFDEPVKLMSSKGGTRGSNKKEAFSSYNQWEKYSFVQIYAHFDCWTHARNQHKPLYTPKMWALIWKVFAAQAGIDVSVLRIHDNGSNYYSDYSEGKGWGVFAARNFSKGELVHDGSLNTVFWNDGLRWKEFIVSLPPAMSCDVLEWSWIQKGGDEGWQICLNLNDSAFMNHGKAFNIATIDNTSLEFYTVRGKLFSLCHIIAAISLNQVCFNHFYQFRY